MLPCVRPEFDFPWRSDQQISLPPFTARPTQPSILLRAVNGYRIIPGLTLGHRWVGRSHPYQLNWWNLGSGVHSWLVNELSLLNYLLTISFSVCSITYIIAYEFRWYRLLFFFRHKILLSKVHTAWKRR